MSEWISVEDELPKSVWLVLTYNAEEDSHEVGYYKRFPNPKNNIWLHKYGHYSIQVTHWQPLPDAPKIEQTKENK